MPRVKQWEQDNPACTRAQRCGMCRKDALSLIAQRRWVAGDFDAAHQFHYNVWSVREIDILRTHAGQPIGTIRTILDRECGVLRTPVAIRSKANKLHIFLKWHDYTTLDLARIFGVGISTVQDWIGQRLLSSYRWNNQPRSKWLVTHDAAITFIRSYPWVYDLGQMDTSHPLYLHARTINRGERWLTAKELGPLLGLSKTHVRDLARRGVLPAHRRGTWWCFRYSEVPLMKDIQARRQAETLHRLRTLGLKRTQNTSVAA